MKKFFLILLWAVFSVHNFSLYSQQKYDFAAEAGMDAAVYRGPEAVKYPFRYEGTPYAYTESFLGGTLVYNGVFYKGLLLNLNAHRDELHLKMPSSGIVIELDRRLVGEFSFGGRNYVALIGDSAVDGLQGGFYQMLYKGEDMLVKKNGKSFHERLQSGSSKGVFRFFDPADRYYVVKGGKPVQVSRMKDFARVYKEEKKAIKGFIRKNKMRFVDMDDKDRTFMEIMNFADNN